VTARSKYIGGIIAMSALYFVTGTIALSLVRLGGVTTILWVPGAIALSTCLLYGMRWWPGIVIGTYLIFGFREVALLPATLVAAVDVGEVLLGCWLLRHWLHFRPELDRVRDVVYLVEVSLTISLLSATTTVTSLFAINVFDATRVTEMWSKWWWSHVSADLIVVPAMLTWARRSRAPRAKPGAKPFEAVALTISALLIVLLVLGRWLPPWLPAANAPYYLLPMMLWAGVRFGPRGAALASLGASVTAIVAQSFGLGPFDRLFDLQTFIAISTVSTLMLSALAIERLRAVERKGAIELAALDGIITIDKRGYVLEINPAAERLFGLRASEACGKDLGTLVVPPRFRDAYQRGLRDYVSADGRTSGSRYRATAWREIDNREFPVEIAITRVPVEDDFLITGFIRDVSSEHEAEVARRAAQEELEHKVEERTSALVAANHELEWRETLMRQAEELAHLGSFDFDLKRKTLHWSDELFRIYGRDVGSFQPSYETFLEAVHPDDRVELLGRIDRSTKMFEPFTFEERIVRPDGSMRVLQTMARVLLDEQGGPAKLLGCCQDITQRKQDEAVTSRLAQLVESSDDAMIGLSPYGVIETWNAAAAKLFGYSFDEVRGTSSSMLVPVSERPRIERSFAAIRAGERVAPYEVSHVRKDGTMFDGSVTMSGVVDRRGQVVGICKVLRDVSHQKSVEKQVRASLREKDVLLREIHHRVKNNLQVIASLLNIQVTAERSEGPRKGLIESQSRIQSMALVHQLLYQSKDLAQIDAGEYLTKLTTRLVETYNIAPDRISVRVFAAPLRLDVDRAIPCGLIVNELVANALTHAFPDERTGTVTVALEQRDETVTLTVADDGIGIGPDVELGRARTFGLRIAYTLAQQLEGTIDLAREQGTIFRVKFPNVARQVSQAA
jgi:PAS domain S-box-containing protein